MDPLEEQSQEIEVLQSIYPDELNLISPTHFTITITLDTTSDRKHYLLLDVKYPESYPEVVPQLDVEVADGPLPAGYDEDDEDTDEEDDYDYEDNDGDDGEPKVIHLAETIEFERNDVKALLSKLNEEAEMNLGMPSVFALVSQLKDEAEAYFQNKVDAAQRKYDKELLAQEMEEQKKFNGTKVTKESFLEWRAKFREEMKFAEKDKERFDAMHHGKMSGKEIFEKGLAGDEDDELVEGIKSVSV
ncbi:protein Gir2p [[Candida] railenensis]|uniref:Protein Gir2p n=1 Tax=[Candida] railenensis TaxID=45579 RepID=A0A9P0VVN9_9ASCO|nr:protein Gir2p [[Candida] railenensis]